MSFRVYFFCGAAYIMYLGYESIASAGREVEMKSTGSGSLRKGILTNLLNPHPYMFWIWVRTPLMMQALELSIFAVVLFVFAFY
ncbi:MAG: LysE family transporter [Bacteroidales bacterium]|nr:LysE family transporter [Bacteroidales bacterium]